MTMTQLQVDLHRRIGRVMDELSKARIKLEFGEEPGPDIDSALNLLENLHMDT